MYHVYEELNGVINVLSNLLLYYNHIHMQLVSILVILSLITLIT